MSWTKKYYPKSMKNIIGQDKPVTTIKEFIENYKKEKKRAILVYGPPGCGKTASIYAIANDLNLEIIEINASDVRNQEGIEKTVGNASTQMSLFAKSKIILVDEVDGLSSKDRGGLQSIVKIIEKSSFPIILTCNDPWDKKFSTLRKKCEAVQFNTLNYLSITNILKNIIEKENITMEEITIKSLARRSGGDLRGAITDLQIITAGKKEISKDDLNDLDQRRQIESIPQALTKIFKTKDLDISITAFDNINEGLDQCALWLDENIPLEYKDAQDLYDAYYHMSKADIFNKRIRRWQYWRFLVYVNFHLTAGISNSKKERSQGFVQYKQTSRLLKIWMANQKNAKKKAIAEKIAKKTHTSKKRIFPDIDNFKLIIKKWPSLINYFDLNKDEIDYLEK